MKSLFRPASLVVMLLAGTYSPASAQYFAATRIDYATGTGPLSVAVVDVNGDGRPDLITANSSANTVSVRLAAGAAGGFSATTANYATDNFPRNVAVADVNADGRPDLLTANNQGSSVSVLLAVGAPGNFASTAINYAAGFLPLSVAVADINADGRLDLISTNAGSLVSARLFDPVAGDFATTRTDYSTGTNPLSVAVADVDADGRPDLITANIGSSNVSVRLAAGAAGSFAAIKTDYATGTNPAIIAVRDVNGDGRPDLITPANRDNTVGVRLAAGAAGAFAATRTDYPTGSGPLSVAVVDVDGDGRPDLMTANGNDNTASVRLAAGAAGNFATNRTDYATGTQPNSVAAVDVNADGRPDLVTANTAGNTVSVRLNTGPLAAATALNAAQVVLAPNPTGAAGSVAISLPAPAGGTAAVFDALGRMVVLTRSLAVVGGQATGTLPTTGLSPGVYVVRLTSNVGTVNKRLVVEQE